jgi:hypothetical protein
MELKLKLENGPEIGRKVKMNMDQLGQVVRESMQEAAHQIADEILFLGAEDIEEAGNFGDRWQEALHADIEETQRTITVNAYMKADEPPVMYWPVFEYGATIKAKNPSGLMWIPFAGGVFGSKGGGADVWPRAYSGSLFRVGNVLFDAKDEQARYFGTPSVTIPKKFHLTEIIKDQASKARALFGAILKENRKH